jgi:hypothetical protein
MSSGDARPLPRRFAPTYKLHPWEPAYDYKDDGDGDGGGGAAAAAAAGRALKRTPAWCDRVLHRAGPRAAVAAEAYRRVELLGSDGRPAAGACNDARFERRKKRLRFVMHFILY